MKTFSSIDLIVDTGSDRWLDQTLNLLREVGFAIVPDIVSPGDRERTRVGFDTVARAQTADVPEAMLRRAAEHGDRDLRLLPKYDPFFYRFLEYPELLSVVDAFLSPSAILRFQLGSIFDPGPDPRRPGPWHMNSRRVMNGCRVALEVGFAIDGLVPGQYHFALGSQQQMTVPSPATLDSMTQTFEIPPGSMFLFDGTLWHREFDADCLITRRLVLQQFVPHFMKPHLDYVRALGAETVRALPARTRRLLGWESRIPASLSEFYVDPSERLYLPNQG